jgi:multicomponent Na+:H+ antiporter subunit D
VLLLSGLLNAGYLFPIVVRAFFRHSDNFPRFGEASPLLVVPLVLTAGLSISLCLWPDGIFHFYGLASRVAVAVLGGGG